jgi:hypothetical protein
MMKEMPKQLPAWRLSRWSVPQYCHRVTTGHGLGWIRISVDPRTWKIWRILSDDQPVRLAGDWCCFVLRDKYCWLVIGGWCVLREKYCWLVADEPSEPGGFRERRACWTAACWRQCLRLQMGGGREEAGEVAARAFWGSECSCTWRGSASADCSAECSAPLHDGRRPEDKSKYGHVSQQRLDIKYCV